MGDGNLYCGVAKGWGIDIILSNIGITPRNFQETTQEQKFGNQLIVKAMVAKN